LGRTPAIEADEVAPSLRRGGDRSRFSSAAATGARPVRGRRHGPATQFWLEVDDSVHVHDGRPPGGAPCLRGGAVALTEALSVRATPGRRADRVARAARRPAPFT
jgi:hypothetical protein